MKSVVAFWFKDSDSLFRDLPLREVREHAERHALLDTALHYLCLGGDDSGCELAQQELARGHGRFHDQRALTAEIAAAYPWLRQRTGRFFHCFLRWLVIERFAAGEPVLAWDADIFFNIPLGTAHRLLAGRTGTASSTCFAALSDPSWFRIFREELGRFEQERDVYLRDLVTAYTGLARAGTLGFSGDSQVGHKLASLTPDATGNSLFDYSPEEVFVDRLIRTGTLPHEWFLENTGTIVCPQLLTLPELHWTTGRADAPRLQRPLCLGRDEQRLTIDGTPLLFVHFQGALFRLCAAHLIAAGTPSTATETGPRLRSLLYPGARPAACAESVIGEFNARRRRIDHDQPPLQLSIAAVARRYMIDGEISEVLADSVSDHSGLWAPTNRLPLSSDAAMVAFLRACAQSCTTRPPLIVAGTDRSARLAARLYSREWTILAFCDTAPPHAEIDGLPVISRETAACVTAATVLLPAEDSTGRRAHLTDPGLSPERVLVAAAPADRLRAHALRCTAHPPLIIAGTGRTALLAARILARDWSIIAFCLEPSATTPPTFDGLPLVDLPTAAAVPEARILLSSHAPVGVRAQLLSAGVDPAHLIGDDDATSGLVIFGTGEGGEQAWSCIASPDQVVCFADNNPARRQAEFHGKKVVDPLTLPAIAFRSVVLASMHASAMRTQLLELGVPSAAIVDLRVPLAP